jgi:hypothetical protein
MPAVAVIPGPGEPDLLVVSLGCWMQEGQHQRLRHHCVTCCQLHGNPVIRGIECNARLQPVFRSRPVTRQHPVDGLAMPIIIIHHQPVAGRYRQVDGNNAANDGS